MIIIIFFFKLINLLSNLVCGVGTKKLTSCLNFQAIQDATEIKQIHQFLLSNYRKRKYKYAAGCFLNVNVNCIVKRLPSLPSPVEVALLSFNCRGCPSLSSVEVALHPFKCRGFTLFLLLVEVALPLFAYRGCPPFLYL